MKKNSIDSTPFNFKTLGPYAFIFASIILFYWDIFLAQGAWIVGDHAEQHFPWAIHLANSLRQGMIPFWTDLIQAGYPIVAEGQIGSFYLPNILFYLLFPINLGYAWNIIFHLVVSGIFMLLYLRHLRLDPRSSVFATMVYLFGSTLGGAYYNITSLKVLCWFPLILILIDRLLEGSKKAWPIVLGLGFLFSFQLLAGYLQFAAYAILFAGFYFLFRFFERPDKTVKKLIIVGLLLSSAVAFAALIAFPQLKLTFDLALQSNRAAPEEGFAYIGSYSPLAFICLFFPSLEGFFASKLYLGIFPLYFILLSFFLWKRSYPKAIYGLVILATLFALGQWSPLYVLIVKSLHFYSFRTPVKFIFFAGFFASVLVAFGMNYLLLQKDSSEVRKSISLFRWACVIVFGIVVITFLAFQFFSGSLNGLGEWALKRYVYEQPGHPFSWEFYTQKLHGFIETAKQVLNPMHEAIWIPLLKMGAAVVLLTFLLRLRLIIFYALALFLLIIDLNFTYSDIRGDYAPYSDFYQKTGIQNYLEAHLGDARYFNYSSNPAEAPVPAGKNMPFGIATANAYSPLIMKDYYRYFDALGGVNDSSGYHPIDDQFLKEHLVLLQWMNVRYLVSDRVFDFEGFTNVFAEGKWSIYELTEQFGMYRLIQDFEVIENNDQVFDRLHQTPDVFKSKIMIQKKPHFFGEIKDVPTDNLIEILPSKVSRKSFNIAVSEDAFFVLSQTFDGKWQAEVDGKQAELYRANGILTALPLKRGTHNVSLWYQPFSSKDQA